MDAPTILRYQGFAATPPLWYGNLISVFHQIDLKGIPVFLDDSVVFKNKRLGKLVEEFVFYQLKMEDSISWICDNLQIQDGKRTVGEIDALYHEAGNPVHLEVAYKFYLYDTLENYDDPLAYWIGPNRKDSLFYKLGKIRNKQFPLLHSKFAKAYLEDFNLDVENIRQALCFKAQLFLPYGKGSVDTGPLNSDCISGFYVSYSRLAIFKALQFYIPAKLDWLVTPDHHVKWIDYTAAEEIITASVFDKRSPLVWLKHEDNKLSKCFVVFW